MPKTCSTPDCSREARAAGLCTRCYQRAAKAKRRANPFPEGKELRELREAARMTRSALAEVLGIDRSAPVSWEKGTVHIPDKYWPEPIKSIITNYKPPGPDDWFWPRVDKNGPIMRPELGPCWEWTGSRDDAGYGRLRLGPFKWSFVTGDTSVPLRAETESSISISSHRLAYQIANGLIENDRRILHACDNPSCCRPDHLTAASQRDNSHDMAHKGRGNRLNTRQVEAIKLLGMFGFTQEEVQKWFRLHPVTVKNILDSKTWNGKKTPAPSPN